MFERLRVLEGAARPSAWHWIAIAILPALIAYCLVRTISKRQQVAKPSPDCAPSVLAIVSPNDEAMAALGFFKLLESVFRGAMRAMRRLILGSLMKGALVLAAGVVAIVLIKRIHDFGLTLEVAMAGAFYSGVIGSAMAVCVALVITLRVLFRIISALILLPVLPDAIRNCLSTEVHVAPVPPGISQTLTISPSRDSVIFHSDFVESDYFEALVKWMELRQRREKSVAKLSITHKTRADSGSKRE